MSKIRTWEELLTSDLPLDGNLIDHSSIYKEYAIIARPADEQLRVDYGLMIMSVVHSVKDPLAKDTELMLVVAEAPIKVMSDDGPYTAKPYVPIRDVIPHYRTADSLGLIGNHHDLNAHSVLVALDKLDELVFTTQSQPLQKWEVDILSGN